MRYLLCWLPDTDINLLRPALDADGLLDLANQGDPDALANMVRLNWMISDVRRSGIIKPIFVRDDTFDVIVGDTRIMAAQLAGIRQVPVMAYLDKPRGTLCESLDHLKTLAGFGKDALLQWSPEEIDPLREPPTWIDIGDLRTSAHGHDHDLRLQAMLDYLENHKGNLDIDWLLQPRRWPGIFDQ
jgi:hypothetical protein